jgi:hypothetical protein
MNTAMIPHTTSRCILAAFFVFALAGVTHAQMDAGFLGRRYTGASPFTESLRHRDLSNGNGMELNGNIPLNAFLDAHVLASYEKFKDYSISDTRFGGSLIGYADLDVWKPFAEVAIANTAQSSTVSGIKYNSSDAYWSVGVGIEAPASRSTAVFALITRNNYFNSKLDSYWTYKFGVNTWFTEKIGGLIAISFFKSESITTSIGLTYRF